MAEGDFLLEAQNLIERISQAETENFLDLLKIIGIDSKQELSGQDLSNIDLSSIDLSDADLTETNLSNANLTDANLTGANLTRAILVGADFTRTVLSNCQGLNLGAIRELKQKGAIISLETEDKELLRLTCETCRHRPASPERHRYLTQLIQSVKPRLWQSDSPYYIDALQQTWIFLCQNLCEGKTAKPYDPDVASIVTWLNAYLKFRLLDLEKSAQTNRSSIDSVPENQTKVIDFLENLFLQPEIPFLIENIWDWLEQKSTELRQIYLENHSEINCYELIRKRLWPETSWQTLEAEFGISAQELRSFYYQKCLPRLQEFKQTQEQLTYNYLSQTTQ